MTHLQHYKQLADGIFGADTCTFDETRASTNAVIGALASTTNFAEFRQNFVARLNRLAAVYAQHPSRLALLTKISEVGSANNWHGAVAELAALDFFTSCPNFLPTPPLLDVTINARRQAPGE